MSNLKLSLALSVVLASGCVAHAPSPLKNDSPSAGIVNSAGNAVINHPEAQGNLVMRIQWPPKRTTQTILELAKSLTVTIRKGEKAIASQTVVPPSDQGGVTYLTFNLDPALGEVTVSAEAFADNRLIGTASPVTVKLRDNSYIGISLYLDNPADMKLRISRQLVLLKDLGRYFNRYQNWAPDKISQRPEITGLMNACKAFGEQVSTNHGLRWNADIPIIPEMAPEGENRILEEITIPGLTGYGLPFKGWDLLGLLLPNYLVTLDTQLTGSTHTMSATLSPKNPGGLTGIIKAMVAAGTWKRERSLYGTLEAHQNYGPALASHSIRLAGGEAPDPRTLQLVSLDGSLNPGSGVFAGGIRADSFTDIGGSPFMQVMRAVNPNTELHTWFPTHATASISTPALAAQAQARMAEDYLSGNAQVNVQIKDDGDAWNEFRAAGSGRISVGQVGGQTAFTGASGSVTVEDVTNDLKAVVSIDARTVIVNHSSGYSYSDGPWYSSGATYRSSYPTLAMDMTIRFFDIPSGTKLGQIHYSYDPNQPPAVGLDAYPVLELDNSDDLRLTPGVFTGQTTGGLSVFIN